MYYPNGREAVKTAIRTGVEVWARGLSEFVDDMEWKDPSMQLKPNVSCYGHSYWKDGSKLYR